MQPGGGGADSSTSGGATVAGAGSSSTSGGERTSAGAPNDGGGGALGGGAQGLAGEPSDGQGGGAGGAGGPGGAGGAAGRGGAGGAAGATDAGGAAGEPSASGSAGTTGGGEPTGAGGTAGSGGGRLGPYACPSSPFVEVPVPSGAIAERIAGVPPDDDFIMSDDDVVILEGPVWLDGSLYVSEIENGSAFGRPGEPSGGASGSGGGTGAEAPPARILKITEAGEVSVALPDVGTNGLALDESGNLVGCSHKTGSVSRLSLAGAEPVHLVATYMGSRFGSPNDLTFGADGTLYFTDPDHQAPSPAPQDERVRIESLRERPPRFPSPKASSSRTASRYRLIAKCSTSPIRAVYSPTRSCPMGTSAAEYASAATRFAVVTAWRLTAPETCTRRRVKTSSW